MGSKGLLIFFFFIQLFLCLPLSKFPLTFFRSVKFYDSGQKCSCKRIDFKIGNFRFFTPTSHPVSVDNLPPYRFMKLSFSVLAAVIALDEGAVVAAVLLLPRRTFQKIPDKLLIAHRKFFLDFQTVPLCILIFCGFILFYNFKNFIHGIISFFKDRCVSKLPIKNQ